MRKAIALVSLLALCSGNASAFASGPEWQWDAGGNAGNFYSGSVGLNDGGGSNPFSRYNAGVTPNMSNDTVSTPPLLIMAGGGADLDIEISRSGVAVTKKVCTGTSTLSVFASPITMCDSGVAANIQGVHVDAVNGGLTFTPRLWIYVAGTGWKQITNHPCGQLEVKQMCK